MFEGQRLAFLLHNLSVALFITLGGDEHSLDARIRMLLNLRKPITYIVEGLLACAVVGEHDSLCALVVRLSDGSESFLASRVPDLQLHILAIHVHSFHFVVNT